jgi:polysaccharide pyruvyl transferase WcaK-like protein
MKIFHSHLGYYNCNVGDQWLVQGLRNLWLEYIGNTVFEERSGFLDNLDDIKNYLNPNFDILLIGGGGMMGQQGILWQIDPNNFKWLDAVDPKIKVIVYGVGLNLFVGQEDQEYFNKAALNVKEVLSKRIRFLSIRRDGSEKLLASKGYTPEHVVWDPAFAVKAPGKKQPKGKYVIIESPGDCLVNRYGEHWIEFKDKLKSIIQELKKKNYKIYFIQQVPVDAWVYFRLPYSKDIQLLSFEECQTNGLDWIVNAKFCIAMRGHTQIVSIALNTPIISISTQNKNVELMRELDLERFNVDVHDPNLVSKVKELIEKVEKENKAIRDLYKSKVKTIRSEQQKDFEEIKKILAT